MSDTIMDLLDDTLGPDGINFSGLRNLETAVPIILIIGESGECGSDSRMDVGVVAEQSFFRCMEEVGAVVDGGLLAGCSAEDFGTPGV